jgi:hypothetical protein
MLSASVGWSYVLVKELRPSAYRRRRADSSAKGIDAWEGVLFGENLEFIGNYCRDAGWKRGRSAEEPVRRLAGSRGLGRRFCGAYIAGQVVGGDAHLATRLSGAWPPKSTSVVARRRRIDGLCGHGTRQVIFRMDQAPSAGFQRASSGEMSATTGGRRVEKWAKEAMRGVGFMGGSISWRVAWRSNHVLMQSYRCP